jgi:hypothetical protein
MGLYSKGVALEKGEVIDNQNFLDAKGVEEINDRTNVYRTDIDKLYHLVRVSKIISLEEVCMILNFDKKKTETWAKTLEKKGLLHVDYPPLGGVILTVAKDNNERRNNR